MAGNTLDFLKSYPHAADTIDETIYSLPPHEKALQSMFTPDIKTATTILLLAFSSLQAGQSPVQPTPGDGEEARLPKGDKDTRNPAEKMFPDGVSHDFGILPTETQAYHAFRIVNTSNVPVKILSVRVT
jgi:hypothetical protein